MLFADEFAPIPPVVVIISVLLLKKYGRWSIKHRWSNRFFSKAVSLILNTVDEKNNTICSVDRINYARYLSEWGQSSCPFLKQRLQPVQKGRLSWDRWISSNSALGHKSIINFWVSFERFHVFPLCGLPFIYKKFVI